MRTLLVALVLTLSLAGCDSQGPQGPPGPPGIQGAPGPVLPYGHFYALMPGDNPATVAVGGAVEFPQDGVANGIARLGASSFVLGPIGVYDVSWQVSISEAGQLVLALDSGLGPVELAHTVAGRATGTSQLGNHVLITTTALNSVVSVRNPTGNPTALSITPLAGGTHSVSASLVIKQLE
jgi:hypothetical protein